MKAIKYIVKNIFFTSISILKLLRYGRLKYSQNLPQTKVENILILGNGPSLKTNLENDMNVLRNMDTLAVNKFCLTSEFYLVQPKYYLFLDPAFYMHENASLEFLELQKNIFDAFMKVEDWDITLFIPGRSKMKDKWQDLEANNKHLNIKYINTNVATGFKSIIFTLYKYNLAMPITQNVLAGAIFLSLNMGYKNIYLLGAEHSWTEYLRVNNENKLFIYEQHYYGKKDMIFYKGIEQKEIWKMHEILLAWSKTFISYFILRDYSEYISSNIYNLTPNSYIDAFPKVEFNELFKK